MSRNSPSSPSWCIIMMTVVLAAILLQNDILSINAFTLRHSSPRTTSLYAMNKRTKFSKQNDLAKKMAEAKRQREIEEGGGEVEIIDEDKSEKKLSAEEIKLRNDKQRFADMLDNSISSGGDIEKGYYLTEEQENENADAVFRGVIRLYEGDPAPTGPFADLLNIENGEQIGKGGVTRLIPWEGSRSASSGDYLVVVTDPRPKSSELRTAMKRLSGAMSSDVLKKCLIINADTPGENRRFLKKTFIEESEKLRIMCDENLELMTRY